MRLTIINGTNRRGNKTMRISKRLLKLSKKLGNESYLVDLNNFPEIFRDDYLNLENANPGQKKDLKAMLESSVLIFVVPTYHHSLPGSLKNFFDLVDLPEIYDGKVIGVVSSNKTRTYGADAAIEVIGGIMAYEKSKSFVVPLVPVINFEAIDEDRLEQFMIYVQDFANRQAKEN